MPDIATDAKWTQYGVRLGRGNGSGNELNQLNFPNAVYINDDQIIYIVDSGNHRILEWTSGATTDQVVVGANGQGDRDNQLNHPTDVIVDKNSDSLIVCDGGNRRVMRWPRQNGTSGEIIISNIDCYGMTMDNNGYLYVSDRSRHEVRRWKIGETNGTLVAGSNGQGNRLDQLSAPTYIFVDQDQSLYVSDQNNHRVVKWMKGAKEGIVVAGGQSQGNSLKQLNYPRGIAIDQLDTVYVADYYNHRVMRWCKGATQGSLVVGGNEKGEEANQLNGPWGLSFDQQGHLYVADYNNHRVQKFHIDLRSTL
jgi:sugar lactone lactonase YvrE